MQGQGETRASGSAATQVRGRVLSIMSPVVLFLGLVTPSASGQCEVAKLTSNQGQPQESFAISVSVSMQSIAVGAPGNPYFGGAYVLDPFGSSWVVAAYFTSPSGVGDDGFGEAVSFRTPWLLIGAYLDAEIAQSWGIPSI